MYFAINAEFSATANLKRHAYLFWYAALIGGRMSETIKAGLLSSLAIMTALATEWTFTESFLSLINTFKMGSKNSAINSGSRLSAST